MRESVDVKDITTMQVRLQEFFRSITTQFNAVTHRMDSDGTLKPINDPMLVKKKTITVTSTTSGVKNVIGDIPAWLGVTAAELKDYVLEVTCMIDSLSDAAATDDQLLFLRDTGNTERIGYDIQDVGQVGTGRQGQPVFNFYPRTTLTRLSQNFTQWGATETHICDYVVVAYRLPSGICEV